MEIAHGVAGRTVHITITEPRRCANHSCSSALTPCLTDSFVGSIAMSIRAMLSSDPNRDNWSCQFSNSWDAFLFLSVRPVILGSVVNNRAVTQSGSICRVRQRCQRRRRRRIWAGAALSCIIHFRRDVVPQCYSAHWLQ